MGTFELAAMGFAGSGVGTALAIPMVWPRSRRPADVRYMGGWLLAGSAIAALISGRVIGLVPVGPVVEHAVNLVGLSGYPLLYLCIQQAGRPLQSKQAAWLWVPAAIYFAILLLRIASGVDTRVPFVWLLPALLAFTAICAITVFGREDRSPTSLVPGRWMVGFLLVLNAAQIVRMQFGHIAPVPAIVPFVMAAGFVATVSRVVWRMLDSRGASLAAARYEKSGLDPDAAARLLGTIDRVLKQDRLFADPQLTLARLASAVGSTSHQVSEVLNRYASAGFHELISRHRVADVKIQLADPAADRFTIEGIGASAGFGSRSALYSAFRRLEGVTPTEYRSRVRGSRDAGR
jgi:AraC-like DNA-binding protein